MTIAVIVLALLVVADIVVSHLRFTAIERRLAPVAPVAETEPEPLPSMTRTQKRERLERAARKKAQESRAAR